MKKLRVGVIGVLIVTALLLSLNLITSAIGSKETEAENNLKSAQNEALLYKQQVAELKKQVDELKSNQYASYQAYEEKISELELKLSATQHTSPAETPKSDARYTYTISEKGITITGYSGSDKKLYIPSNIDGVSVVAIGREAFKNASFEDIIIPQGVEKIDWFAFSNCLNLKSIELPNSISKIEYGAFDGVGNFVISCSKNSYAHKYSKSYGYDVEIN